jgi:serine/threonine-protein kinase
MMPAVLMQKFGKYEILEKVGVGGFGVVYKAFDPHIKRLVAVKTCTTDDAEIRHRFFQEAEIAGNLQHRNLVTVYDFGVQEDVPYLVQEFLTGEDLEHKIKQGTDLPYADRISFLVQIARGLEFAHTHGVIHRDIKPANIRILEDGAAKIMDFGIAKLAQRHSGLTQTGMTLGTAAYLAPEQIKGEGIDPRTDLFSFGVMAYELLTLLKAFEGETLSAVIYQILHKDPPPVSRVWTDAPPEADAIVARCLAKDPDGRYPTTRELVVDLELLLRQLRSEALGTTPKREVTASNLPTMALPRGGGREDLDATLPWRKAPTIDLPPRPAAADLPAQPPRPTAGSPAKWLAAAAVLVAAGVGGWLWLGRGASHGEPAAAAVVPPPTVSVSAPPARVAPSSAKEAMPGGPTTAAAAESPPTHAAASSPSQPANVPPTDTDPPTASPPPAVPAPTPQPLGKATVVLAAGWDPRMTVSIDGQVPQPLDRPLRGEITEGAHEFVFSLETPEFSASQKVRRTLEADQTHEIGIPIAAPGRLTVQAALSSPIGQVKVDGKDLGPSPVRSRLVLAGTHSVEILDPRNPEPSKAISQTIEMRAGFATTVTFDLATGELTTREKPAGGS